MTNNFNVWPLTALLGLTASSVWADVTIVSQEVFTDAFVQRADTGDPLDGGTGFDDGPGDIFASAFARYDIPEGGVVDGEAEASVSNSTAEISVNGFAASNATELAFGPEVFSAVTSSFTMNFEVVGETVVQIRATLSTSRDQFSSPDEGSIEVSSNFGLVGDGMGTILNGFNDEGEEPTVIERQITLGEGSYTLGGFASVTERADELFDVRAEYELFVVLNVPPACPADLDRDGEFGQGDVLAMLDGIDLLDTFADWDASGEIDAFDLFAFLTEADPGCE